MRKGDEKREREERSSTNNRNLRTGTGIYSSYLLELRIYGY